MLDDLYDNNDAKLLAEADIVLPTTLPIVHVNNAPMYPGLIAPILLYQNQLIKAVEISLSQSGYIALLMSKKNNSDSVSINDLYTVGVTAKIIKKVNMPDGGTSVLLQGIKKFKVKQFLKNKPFVIATLEYVDDILEKDLEFDALVRVVRSLVKALSKSNPIFSDELRLAMINMPNPGMMADLVMYTLGVEPELAQQYLELIDVKERYKFLLTHLKKEQEVSELQSRINKEVNSKISSMQREYFLKEQLKVIKKELGYEQDEKSHDISKLKKRFETCGIHEEGAKIVQEELEKLAMIPETSPEYSVTRNYIDWVVKLPWKEETKDDLDISKARTILNSHHFGLDKVKDRILEYLAVRRLNPSYEGNILLFLGPPGVGKTSLGVAIAEAMGRKFFRFSLGGMRDEAEIKGHRRTYIGSMPGKIVQGLKRVASKNPVIMLDEIDKLGMSYQGDPSAALLEVLDPEQNNSFLDHFIDIGFDLSNVLFICTANSADSIPAPLYDRMELIDFTGYVIDEKIEIAKKYLMPKLLKKHGLSSSQISLSKQVLKIIINKYARDPGIRLLEKQISKLMRKVAMNIAASIDTKTDKKNILEFSIENIEDYLGPFIFNDEIKRRINVPGVATGLAWTAYGGDILFIEATNIASGKGEFKYTGKMGDVMKESAMIAYTYARKHLAENQKKNKFFNDNEIHLHIPSGAIPKDGPSAGITMCVSLLSLAMGKKLSTDLAMSGELSLVGKVLPVGGIKEKLLACVRSGIKNVILPDDNKKDLKEVPKNIKNNLNISFVKNMQDVVDICF